MSDQQIPKFVPPPATEDVPAFLRGGEKKPTFRAAGGCDMYGYAQSASPFGHSFTPAPLQFQSPANTKSVSFEWDAPLAQQAAPPKKLGGGLGDFSRPQLTDFNSLEQEIQTKVQQSQEVQQADNKLAVDSKYADFIDYDDAEFGKRESLVVPQASPTIRLGSVFNAAEVLSNLSTTFDKEASFEIDFDHRRIAGVVMGPRCTRCQFVVTLTPEQPGEHLACFERTAGCPSLFSSFFAATSAKLRQAPFFSTVETTTPFASFAVSDGAPAWQPENGEGLGEEGCLQLVEMCHSKFADVRQEALQSVATMSSSQAAQMQQWAGAQLVQAMSAVAKEQSQADSVQHSLACLAENMCAVEAFALQALPLLPLLFGLLDQVATAVNLPVLRSAASAVQLLAQRHGNLLQLQLPGTMQYLSTLEAHLNSSDPTLQASVRQIILA